MRGSVRRVYDEILKLEEKGVVNGRVKITDIKHLRSITGLGLHDVVRAKEFYEAMKALESVEDIKEMKKFVRNLMLQFLM